MDNKHLVTQNLPEPIADSAANEVNDIKPPVDSSALLIMLRIEKLERNLVTVIRILCLLVFLVLAVHIISLSKG